MYYKILLALLLILVQHLSIANHFLGGTLSCENTGGNFYIIHLVLYRDCSGEPMIPQSLTVTNDCGTSYTMTGLNPALVEEVSPVCAAELQNSTCNGGSLIGVEAYRYETMAFLSTCDGWTTVNWSICCRDLSLNVMDQPGIYMETRLQNLIAPSNSSAIFSDHGVPHVCVGQPVTYDPQVFDPDGNSLRYKFIDARFASPIPIVVNYVIPHYGAEPWTGMVIDSISGLISFTPNTQGSIIVVVEVEEKDNSGNLISTVMRDFRINVIACTNTPPPAGSGQFTSASGGAHPTGPRIASVCTNGSFCLDAVFTDPDVGQSLSLQSNVEQVLSGATFTVSGTNPATATICWDATDAPWAQRTFTITALDDNCPIVGTQTYSYTLSFAAPPAAGTDGTALACPQTAPYALVDSLDGTVPPGGSWTNPDDQPHSGIFNPGVDGAGDYTYTVTSFPGCSGSSIVTVTMLAESDSLCLTLGLLEQGLPALELYPNPSHGTLYLRGLIGPMQGALDISILDMQGRTVAAWTGHPVANDQAIQLPEALVSGSYLLRVGSRDQAFMTQRFQLQR